MLYIYTYIDTQNHTCCYIHILYIKHTNIIHANINILLKTNYSITKHILIYSSNVYYLLNKSQYHWT